MQLGDELHARRPLDERVFLVGRREVAHAPGVAAVGAVRVLDEDHGQSLGAERVDQPVHVADDVARVLHVGRAVLIEVLALHVDDEERHLPVLKVVDHLSRPRRRRPGGT